MKFVNYTRVLYVLGEILTFDNHRILHGRKEYEGSRLLIGGYLDWDLIESKMRVLQSDLSNQNNFNPNNNQ